MLTCSVSLGESIIEEVNRVARGLYLMHGEVVSEHFRFYQARGELAKRCWNAAVVAYINSVKVDDEKVVVLTKVGQGRKVIRACRIRCTRQSTICV